MRAPTVADVGRVAGVSVASVSRALQDKNLVSDELYQRVMAAVKEVGYRPQRVHKSTTITPWVVVLITHIAQQFYTQVSLGIQEHAEANGYLPVIFRLMDGKDQVSRIIKQIHGIPLTGIVALGIEDLTAEEWIQVSEEAQAPITILNQRVNHPKIASVMVNFEAASAQVTRHLLDLGHTRIAYLGDHNWSLSADEFNGMRAALNERGISYPDEFRISIPYVPEGASQGVSRLMALPPDQRPTAIFAFDDEVAIDVLTALRYYDMRIPEDISVVGFDNIPMAAHTYPSLTTVDVPQRRIGLQMVSLLEELANNSDNDFGATLVNCSLVVRRSTGPAPALAGPRFTSQI